MARPLALAAAIVVSLLAVSGAGGAATQQTPKRGGAVYLQAGEPPCLNYLVWVCHAGTQVNLVDHLPHWVLGRAYESTADFSYRPVLVSHVDFTKKPPYVLTYHVQPNARWSDGVPVSARDFVFTHAAIRRLHSPEAQDYHLTHVRSVRALDPKTVRVVLKSRLALWRRLFPFVLPSHALRGEDLAKIWVDRIDNPKTGAAIGTGPFLVERWERGKQLTLRRNPRYWGAHPAYLDRLVIRFYPPGGADVPPDRLLRGEVDVDGVLPARVPEVRRTPGVRVVPFDTTSWEHFELRVGPGGHPALKLKAVRQALAYGLDRVALTRAVIGDVHPTGRPSDSVVHHDLSDGFQANWARYRYRPAEARRLLERAGCRRGSDGIYLCAGERLSLRFYTTAGRPERALIMERAQAQLQQAGIEARPLFAPGVRLFNEILPRGEFDVALFTTLRAGDPTSGLLASFGCGGRFNLSGYCQRLVTADLDQSDRILDPTERARVLNRADRQLARDVPVIPLFWVTEFAAVRSSLRNYVAGGSFRNAENWWLDR